MSSVVNDQVATLNFLYCHEDARQARPRPACACSASSAFFNANLLPTREAYPTRAYQSLGALAPHAGRRGGQPRRCRAASPRASPSAIPSASSEAIKRWESIGVDALNFIVNAVEAIPQEEVLASLRLFAAEVMPHFRTGR